MIEFYTFSTFVNKTKVKKLSNLLVSTFNSLADSSSAFLASVEKALEGLGVEILIYDKVKTYFKN